MKVNYVLFSAMLLISVVNSHAQEDGPRENTQSPYFLIEGEHSSIEHLPLLSTRVDVSLVGPVADVRVEQVYKNNGKIPIEAIYIFPASTRAAVYDMQMIVGERTIRAEIQDKNKAREKYRKAREEGKRASLLEQERANVFSMQVANVMPGDVVQVVIRYNEYIIPENQTYSFLYPTTVGPRYVSSAAEENNTAFTANLYMQEGDMPSSLFDIIVNVNMAIPISHAASTSHSINLAFKDKNQAVARLATEERHAGNRDFIFDYKVSGGEIESGTWLYEHNDEKFFLTTIEPPASIGQNQVLPREYIFVIDVSGSMHGFPLATSKTLIRNLVSRLRPDDYFNMLLFAGDNKLLSDSSLPATKENVALAFRLLDEIDGGGGTELLPALKRLHHLPKECAELSRSIVIVTDGYISVEPEVFDLIDKSLRDANVFAFGIGSGVNRLLIEGMAHVGRGEAFIVTKPELAKEACDRFIKYIERPVLSNIKVSFEGFDAYDMVPANLPDLMAERPIYIFGKYRGLAKGQIVLSGDRAQGRYVYHQVLNEAVVDSANMAIRYLWAREKIRWNQDFNQLSSDPNRVAKISALGLKYNLLTDYTSFVAVEETEIINPDGMVASVKQVLPLPQGVSNYAIGFDMSAEGVSHLNLIPDSIFVVPVVLSEIESDKKLIIEEVFSYDMHVWGHDVLAEFEGKIMEITLAEKISDIIVTVDAVPVTEMRRRYTMLLLLRLKWELVAGEKLRIHFQSGLHIADDPCGC
ncbi:MAG: VWA domain-containing protein [Saprospiraceae bacterium]|nr:VWA domain-containing protein [Saprospiraceae bacterium]